VIWIWLVFILLHIICCVLTYLGIQTGALSVHRYMFFTVLFVPFWGILTLLILEKKIILKKDGIKNIDVEKMKLDSDIYRGLTVEDRKNTDRIIPMEEALIINNPRERRELIMDVLNDNPGEYIEFLQKAGNNDDTEVVHYAVTAMVEISKENDYRLQQLEKEYKKNPDDYELLCEYCEFLWGSLEQNLVQGQAQIVNRHLFDELSRKKLTLNKTITDYVRLIQNGMELKSYSQVSVDLKEMDKYYHESQELLILRLQYYSSLGRGEDIKMLLSEIEREQIYLSSQAKEVIAFWKN